MMLFESKQSLSWGKGLRVELGVTSYQISNYRYRVLPLTPFKEDTFHVATIDMHIA